MPTGIVERHLTEIYVFGFLVLLVAIVLMINEIQKEKKRLVCKYSTQYAQTMELNDIYRFRKIDDTVALYNRCRSKAQFDRFNARDFLIAMAMDHREALEDFVFDAEYNRLQYQAYREKLSAVLPTSDEIIRKKAHIDANSFHEIENRLCGELLVEPVLNPVINVKYSYVSEKGRNTYTREALFHVEDIEEILHAANKRMSYEDSRQYQRTLMTDALRYRILKRDNFRCTICGASSADGAKLEVDHIKPVSKGGKTEPSNLRTLCKSCNRGKRDRYDPGGLN